MPTPLRVAITGASGFVGTALSAHLGAEGHTVLPMVRRTARDGEIRWDPDGHWDPGPLSNVDAVVHLAGAGIADRRWTSKRKALIESSRIAGTRDLVGHIGTLAKRPRILVSASAIGFYGDRGDAPVDESSPSGHDWLAGVAVGWEAEAMAAGQLGLRSVCTRFGIILSPKGGALGKMLLPFRLGLGGRLGSGTQVMSWVDMEDLVRGIVLALTDDRVTGPINLVSPAPVTNAEFTRTLGQALGRPTPFPVPAFALRLALGELADAALLASQRVVPAKLQSLGYTWVAPSLAQSLARQLTR